MVHASTRWILPAILLALLAPHVSRAEMPLSYADLIQQMVDLQQPAVLPAEGETCKQWSSWDRSSRFDEETGKYVNWGANNDGPNFIRTEGDQVVMAEMEGSGCIWRIWSALAEGGHVKIYLDGAEQPAVDLPFVNYFSGDTAPFNYPMLSYNLADQGCRGQNLYFPIPYRKSCKIVADSGWGRYYQFTYTTYPPGTDLPTFSTALAAENTAALRNVNVFLQAAMGTDPAGNRDGQQNESGTVSLGPGAREVLELTGPRAITAIRGKMTFADREDEMAALRSVVLKITWDDDRQPAVWCPLGDFFGTAPGRNPYRSLLTGMTEQGGYALWYMPFAERAKIELVNEGDVDRKIDFEIRHAPLPEPLSRWGRFHCKWHRDTVALSEDRWPDWTMLTTEGRGRFCGVMLHVWNPRGGWWGEGDEKFFVDGEKYPSTFGTGSEDYFGYAWCHPGLFQRPYHAQTMTEGNQGHQSVLRWQLADNIPFQQSFEGVIEKYYRTEERGTQYACTVCWYLAPGGVDPYDAVPLKQRHGYYTTPPLAAGGFRFLERPRGNVSTQAMNYSGGKWQDDNQLWWTGAKMGDRLQIVLPVEADGTYAVSVVLTKARDYGIVQLYLDDKKLGEPIDLYHPDVVPTDPLNMGDLTLKKGDHKLTVEIVGSNSDAVPSLMFGLDRVILRATQ